MNFNINESDDQYQDQYDENDSYENDYDESDDQYQDQYDESDDNYDENENEYDDYDESDDNDESNDGIEIQYNKESIKIPKGKIKEYLQKGYHADKVFDQRDDYKQKYEDLLKQRSQQSIDEYVDTEVNKLIEEGMPESIAKRIVASEKRIKEFEDYTRIQHMNAANKEYIESKKKSELPIFNHIENSCYKLMEEKNVDFETAYRHLRGEIPVHELNKIIGSSSKMQKVYDTRRRGIVGSSEGQNSKNTKDYSKYIQNDNVRKIAQQLNINISKVGERIKNYKK